MDLRRLERALLSVSDKRGLVELAQALVRWGVELLASGGTGQVLRQAGLAVREVAEWTGFPEILQGRVKTLHPRIHGGILARRDQPEHLAELARQGIAPIDLVVCNLYPFEAVLAGGRATEEELLEQIDIGGPSLIRAAAKNHSAVAVLVAPEQYPSFIEELTAHQGAISLATRQRLAATAFAHTAAYDVLISQYFSRYLPTDQWPARCLLHYVKRCDLRYGENPHQRAAFYVAPLAPADSLAGAEQRHGKELSYNNLLDLDSALRLLREFVAPAAVIIKHNNPCGAALGSTLAAAVEKAYAGDPLSAYGGILGVNRPVDEEAARQITEPGRFFECLLAPDYTEAAWELLTTRPSWKKSVRLLRLPALAESPPLSSAVLGPTWEVRQIRGGLLVQTADEPADDFAQAQVVTPRAPNEQEWADLRFAWRVCKHVKSNAIVLARQGQVVGVGAGQMSRVDAVQLAIRKAGERSRGAVLASDAFFPFRDSVEEAARAGITALVQPGGSIRDADSLAACAEHGLAMVFTGVRHFRH
jgi:phosphoribosylaminoimidazolecarboxamide formyltransferase/IMP cyclohydrolase